MEVNEKYGFIGDATALTMKVGMVRYIAQKLYDEIRLIDSCFTITSKATKVDFSIETI